MRHATHVFRGLLAALAAALAAASVHAQTRWVDTAVPKAGTRAQFFGITVPSAGQALAVGAYNPGETPTQVLTRPHAQWWNGSAWQALPVPLSPVFTNQAVRLSAAASTADGLAWAVGYVENPASLDSRTLAYQWDGGQWLQVPTPNPGEPGTGNRLHAVIGSPGGTAWAAGEAGYPARSLMLRWTDGSWQQVATPDLGPLRALAADGGTVWAAGGRRLMSDPGSGWAELPAPPLPTGAQALGLTGIAVEGGRVWVVGIAWRPQGDGLVSGPYAAFLAGSEWTVVVGVPAGNGLTAVSATDGIVRATSTDGRIVRLTASGATEERTPRSVRSTRRLDALAVDAAGRAWAAGTLYDRKGTPRGAALTTP